MKKFIIALMLMVMLAGCGSSDTLSPDMEATVNAALSETPIPPTDTPAPTDTPIPPTDTPAPTDTPIPPTDTPIPATATPFPEMVSYSGAGDRIVSLDWEPTTAAVVHITHSGDRNFAVWSIGPDNQRVDLLVNTVGDYDGVVPLNIDTDAPVSRLEITADGDWTAEVAYILAARASIDDAPVEGRGDDVVILLTDESKTFDTAQVSGNAGGRLFAMWVYSDTGRDLAINTTDPYDGQILLPPAQLILLVISAEGPWQVLPTLR